MPVGKYLQKKRLQKYCQGYIQYEKLIYHLKEVMDLDKRKFSHFAYDIIQNPKGTGYLVTPKVSEEEIEQCYSKFIFELRNELERVDAYFINFVNQVELKLNVVKNELFETTFNTQFWLTKESNQFNFQNLLKELEVIKTIVEDFKTNIIPINKFCLIKIYEKQQYLVGKTSSKLETYDNGKDYLNWELDHWMDQPLISRYLFCSNGCNITADLLRRIDCIISKCRIKFLPKVLNEELIF